MARKPRMESPTGVYHFMTRGVNKKKIFIHRSDYTHYLSLVKEYRDKLGIEIYHYCVMSSHAHIALRAASRQIISSFGHFTHRRYAYYFCKTYRWPEQVFRRPFQSKPIADDAYLLECGRYIERNPIEASIVESINDYPYSSYAFYASGKKDDLVSESPLYQSLGNNAKERMAAYRFYINHERVQKLQS